MRRAPPFAQVAALGLARVVPGTSHRIAEDDPAAVIRAVRDVVEQADRLDAGAGEDQGRRARTAPPPTARRPIA